jgi:hypothetical protein
MSGMGGKLTLAPNADPSGLDNGLSANLPFSQQVTLIRDRVGLG